MAFDRAQGEGQLELEDIQGDVLVGLQKDWQSFIGVRIIDVPAFKSFLKHLAPDITTARKVFERELQLKAQKKVGTKTRFGFVGTNIGFTFDGLTTLGIANLQQMNDGPFKAGLFAQSASLGDPTSGEGAPANWRVGGDNSLHGLLTVTGPDKATVSERVLDLKGRAGISWAVSHEEVGHTRFLDRGHEHFGFLDGVSQPAIRGQIDKLFPDHKFLNPSENPHDPGQGLPGADLHWPGEFVFGYPAQKSGDVDPPGPIADGGLPWMKNGTYLVYRRLKQLVPEFDAFVDSTASSKNSDPTLLAARMMGRWQSGAPVSLAPLQDNPEQGGNEMANNDFEFDDDAAARKCPFAAHIRKAYPRNDITPAGAGAATDFERRELSEADTQTHRIIRRGIPFGEDLTDAEQKTGSTTEQRGLMFVAYQTSIERQFEFIIKNWINNTDFAEVGVGQDPILGQASGLNRARNFAGASINYPTGPAGPSTRIPADFIIPTGGGYFFVPSINALRFTIST